jgi:hypothetical protein
MFHWILVNLVHIKMLVPYSLFPFMTSSDTGTAVWALIDHSDPFLCYAVAYRSNSRCKVCMVSLLEHYW